MTPRTIALIESIDRICNAIDDCADWMVAASNELDPDLRGYFLAMNAKTNRELKGIIEKEEKLWTK